MTFYMGGGRKVGYVPGKDPVLDDVMHSWQSKYCSFSDTSVCITTFNVNGRSAPAIVPGWFQDNKKHDFYVVGLQEMDLSVGTYIIDNTKKEEEWLECIRRSLPASDNYVVVRSQRLVGIYIVLLKSEKCNIRISNLQNQFVATGIPLMGSKLGNKGGTALSLKMNDTMVCFVNSHLAAGNGELERRNQDFRDISGIVFIDGRTLWDHDVIFWFGDLNYRLCNEIGRSNEEIRSICMGSRYAELFQYDQLYREMHKSSAVMKVWDEFQEASPIPFPPTYKYDVGTNNWDSSEKARAPAWCDRILWRRMDNDTMVALTAYESLQHIIVSDHKPVRSTFQLTLKQIDQAKADRLYEEAIREADRRANELLPQISFDSTEIDFGEVFFMEPLCKPVLVRNTGKSTAVLKFTPRPSNKMVSARWLQVTPISYRLRAGEQIQISLTIVIDKQTSWEQLDSRTPSLTDILVLSLENGRDYFIPVSAKYMPQVFGTSLHALVRRTRPTQEALISFEEELGANEIPGCPTHVPQEFHKLIAALRKFGHEKLDIYEVVDNSVFCRIRAALENDAPQDLTIVPDITAASLYSALMRLIDSLKEPIIPLRNKEAFLMFCTNPARLWNEVSQTGPENAALIEYITTYLRELISGRANVREQLPTWADLLFRETSFPTAPRLQALTSLVSYAKDVSLFHPLSTTDIPALAPPPPPRRTTSTVPRTGSTLF